MSKFAHAASFVSVSQLLTHMRTPLYRNAYALTFAAATTSGLGMVYWLVAARYYATDVVGLNSAAMAATLLLSGISGLYLDGALIRFVPSAGRTTGRLIAYAYGISAVVTILVTLLFLAGIHVWAPALAFLNTNLLWIAGFAFVNMTTAIFVLQDAALIGLGQTSWIVIKNTAMAVAKVVLLIIFAKSMPQFGIFASWIIPSILLIVPTDAFIFRRLLPRHWETTKDIVISIIPSQVARYVAANYVAYLFYVLSTAVLPLLVIQQVGSTANAYFYLPWVMANLIPLITSNMSTSLTVEGSRNPAQLGNYARRALVHNMTLLVPTVGVVLVSAPYILRIFGDNYAIEGSWLLRLLALAAIPNIIQAVYNGISRVQQKIVGVVIVQTSNSILSIGLSYIFLQMYGITGVGMARLTSQTVVAVVLVLLYLRPMLKRVHK